jgi:RNA polymerase sigma-70 factor (ECF subfamily)
MNREPDPPNGAGPDGPGSTASSFLEGLLGEEASAWERLVDRYAPLVYSWARRRGVPPQDVADIGQDVFLGVATSLRNFRGDRPDSTFRGWLRQITEYKVTDYFRAREARALVGHAGDPPAPVAADSGDGSAPPRPFAERLARAIEAVRARFEPRTWAAFEATDIGGRPVAEVAEELGMTRGAVHVARSKVRGRLREALGDWPPGPASPGPRPGDGPPPVPPDPDPRDPPRPR